MEKIYLQYGCGLSAPQEWNNFDSSPRLRLQKIPVLNLISGKKVIFPSNVKYGDILKKLPGIELNSCDGIYCSHVLEHLALADFRKALQKTFDYLKPGGIFRCVVPDLEFSILEYIKNCKETPDTASIEFLNTTMLGVQKRSTSLYDLLSTSLGNSHHLWMWDQYSLKNELKKIGFINIRRCAFNDSTDKMFQFVEEKFRFIDAVAFESVKP